MDCDQKQENTVENLLKEILKLSLPLCDNGNPEEKTFVEINRKAHEALIHYRKGIGKDPYS